MLSSKINTYIMLFAIYLDGTVHISELFLNFLSFIHNNRIIMGGGALFCPPTVSFKLITYIILNKRKYFSES